MNSNTTRALVAVALLLGGLAPLAGTPYLQQQVDAVDLAAWIKDRKPGLRVIDVRPPADFDEVHIPTAESIPLEGVSPALVRSGATVVIYSGGGAQTAQARVFLKAQGHDRVFLLTGGLDKWIDDVMNPMLAVDATAEEKTAYDRAAPLSRYFGGQPRSGVPRAELNSTRAKAQQLKRRGC
jgi:rhodanese-related sulfurtransferase